MPVEEGVNIDLQFLLLEVKKQAKASASMIERPSKHKLERIRVRESYIDNLKNTLENKSYFKIHHQEERQMNYYKALITIASNLERCADFFTAIAEEMQQVAKPDNFLEFNLKRYYRLIYRAIDSVFPAISQHDLKLAQKVCDYKELLDEYYLASFYDLRGNLRQRRQVDDMLSLLTIVKYLERVGGSLLNIGEAILDIHVGEKMGILQFRSLKHGLESLGLEIDASELQFRSIMNTRSGCRVAKIITGASQVSAALFYKEGTKKKIAGEIKGLNLWQQKFPDRTPKILWHQISKNSATLLLEFIEGYDLLEILLKHRGESDAALKLLTQTLKLVWEKSKIDEAQRSDYIAQLLSRKSDIQSVHANLFDDNPDFASLLDAAVIIEKKISTPFQTLIHGDLNADNIIFKLSRKKMHFVDVHRSKFGDYVQDVSVFLVSNFRIPVLSQDIRSRLNRANLKMYACAAKFAQEHKDEYFEVRLALGLFRSLITSTRFILDKEFSAQLFERGVTILRQIIDQRDDLQQFKLTNALFLYA